MTTASKGNFVWYEHMTKDPAAAIAFYGEAVGWKTEPFGDDGYQMWVGSQGPLGGVTKLPDEVAAMGIPPHWMGHVQVDDVDAAAAYATAHGGKVHHGPMDVPTVGRFAVIADPQGAAISVFKPEKPMEQHDVAQEGEFCWNELITSDPDAALGFYGELLGWKVMDEMDMGPMGKYRLFGVGDKMLGGIMKTPPDMHMPPAWLYYTETSDIDAAIARATRGGATIANGPMDVPGGRAAQLIDPQGAVFALHQAAPKADAAS